MLQCTSAKLQRSINMPYGINLWFTLLLVSNPTKLCGSSWVWLCLHPAILGNMGGGSPRMTTTRAWLHKARPTLSPFLETNKNTPPWDKGHRPFFQNAISEITHSNRSQTGIHQSWGKKPNMQSFCFYNPNTQYLHQGTRDKYSTPFMTCKTMNICYQGIRPKYPTILFLQSKHCVTPRDQRQILKPFVSVM